MTENQRPKKPQVAYRVELEKRIQINKSFSLKRNQAVAMRILSYGLFGQKRYQNLYLTCSLNCFHLALKIANNIHQRVSGLSMIIKFETVQVLEYFVAPVQEKYFQEKKYSKIIIKLTRNPTEDDKKQPGFINGLRKQQVEQPLQEVIARKNRQGRRDNRRDTRPRGQRVQRGQRGQRGRQDHRQERREKNDNHRSNQTQRYRQSRNERVRQNQEYRRGQRKNRGAQRGGGNNSRRQQKFQKETRQYREKQQRDQRKDNRQKRDDRKDRKDYERKDYERKDERDRDRDREGGKGDHERNERRPRRGRYDDQDD